MNTMGQILSHWRILTAMLFSVVLVIGAYALARGVGSPPIAQASTEAALLQAIATRDSSGSGLPDWQKALYGIPINATTTDYFNLGMTDGEALARGLIVPKAISDIAIATSSSQSAIDPSLPPAPGAGTLTDTFAQTFFALYLNAKAANNAAELSPSQVNDLANQSLSALSSLVSIAPDYKSAKDLTIAGSGAEALKAFAASAEAVILKNKKESNAVKNEVLYLQDIVERNDTSAFPHLVSIAKMYRESAAGLAALPIPSNLSTLGLALINIMMRESGITSDFARVNTDPLAAMFALDQYIQVNQSIEQIFSSMSDVFTNAGVTLPAGAPGAVFLDTISLYRVMAPAP